MTAPVVELLTEIPSHDGAEAARFLGSPTVRADASTRSEYGLGCHIYPHAEGMRDTPPESWIHDARRARGCTEPGT